MWLMVYNTMFGGASVFLFGMLAASIKNVGSRKWSFVMTVGGSCLFVLLAVVIAKMGGYQTAEGEKVTAFWMFFPEIISAVTFLILKGIISLGDQRQMKGAGLCSRSIIHIGRVSYSGYVFHLFVLDFWLHFVGQRFDHGSVVDLGISFIAYYCILVAFSHITYNAIELPFLRYRRVYQEHLGKLHEANPPNVAL